MVDIFVEPIRESINNVAHYSAITANLVSKFSSQTWKDRKIRGRRGSLLKVSIPKASVPCKVPSSAMVFQNNKLIFSLGY